jgi:hypothetical protein
VFNASKQKGMPDSMFISNTIGTETYHSAWEQHVDRQFRAKETGKEFVPASRRQIYVGYIAFNVTQDDVARAIFECTHCDVFNVTMPRTQGRHRGYAFVEIKWPLEYDASRTFIAQPVFVWKSRVVTST